MKAFIIIATFLFSFNAVAQQSTTETRHRKNHVLKTNVLGLFTFFYEHPLKRNMSLQVGLQYNPESLPVKNKLVSSIAPELRFYFGASDNSPSGFFMASYTKYQYMTENKADTQNAELVLSANIQTLAFGGNMGYQIILKNGLSFEAFVGGGYNIFKDVSSDKPSDFSPEDYKFDMRIGISFGYAF